MWMLSYKSLWFFTVLLKLTLIMLVNWIVYPVLKSLGTIWFCFSPFTSSPRQFYRSSNNNICLRNSIMFTRHFFIINCLVLSWTLYFFLLSLHFGHSLGQSAFAVCILYFCTLIICHFLTLNVNELILYGQYWNLVNLILYWSHSDTDLMLCNY